MTIIDRRKSGAGKSLGNREKFMRRYKKLLKKQVEGLGNSKKMKDLLKDEQDVIIYDPTISEPTFNHDGKAGNRKQVLPGNKHYNKGDHFPKPKNSSGNGRGGSDSGDGEDAFVFTLTKEEFLELYFEGMGLPRFIKRSLAGDNHFTLRRAGYSRDGIPARLNAMKTLEMAAARRVASRAGIARRIEKLEEKIKKTNKLPLSKTNPHLKDPANRAHLVRRSVKTSSAIEGIRLTDEQLDNANHLYAQLRELRKKKPAYLDDIDLRYHILQKTPKPIHKAVMFCIMDASASMTEDDKMIAKKFFMLLFLFLNKEYDHVDVRFIQHTHTAHEVTENQFFYGRITGGTVVSSALNLTHKIIDKEYDLDEVNVYIAQASDGDNYTNDNYDMVQCMREKLLPIVQYFAYMEINTTDYQMYQTESGESIISLYKKLEQEFKHLQSRIVHTEKDVYPILKELFSAEEQE